jgi:ankyrin repeat protein
MLLRDERVDVNAATLDGCSPLYIASFQGQTDAVLRLLAHPHVHVSVATHEGLTPLHAAAVNGHTAGEPYHSRDSSSGHLCSH